MKKLIFILGILAVVIACNKKTEVQNKELTSYAVEGGVDGGGGKGVLCGTQLTTLDLYEAQQRGEIISSDGSNLDENLNIFGFKMLEYISDSPFDESSRSEMTLLVYNELQTNIMQKFIDIPSNKRLKPTNDATLPALETNCAFVQIAIYSNDGKIYRDLNYWNQLSALGQASLMIHEWVYYRARLNGGVLTSDESRKAVGNIFSNSNLEPILAPIWNDHHKLGCGAGGAEHQEIFDFEVIDELKSGVSGLGIYFVVFKNVMVTLRTSAFLPGLTKNDFLTSNFSPLTLTANNPQMNREWTLEIEPGSLGNNSYSIRAYSKNEIVTEYSNA